MLELLPLTLMAAQAVARIENVHTQRPALARGDPDKVVCVRETRIGSRVDTRRICRTRAEWDQLAEDTRRVMDRVQQFPGCGDDPSICRSVGNMPGGPR